jgi:ribosomal protein L29
MAQKRLEKWRKDDLEELKRRLDEMNVDYMKLISLVKAGGSIEKPGRIRHLKRQRARLLTIINERRRGITYEEG